MSIKKLCSRDSVTIKRLETVYDANFGTSTKTWTTAARTALSLPTSMTCRIQPLTSEELIAFGVRGESMPIKLYFSSSPQLSVEDHIVASGIEYEVVRPSLDFDLQGRLHRVLAQKWTVAE